MNHAMYDFTRPPGDGVPMDLVHVDALHALALGLPDGSLIAEIGSYCGSSASAYIEAMKRRPDLRLHLYEIKPHPELRRLLAEAPADVAARTTLSEHPAPGRMLEPAALILIDGDHRWPGLMDVYQALSIGCQIIAAHDTRIISKKCDGSRAIGRVLRTEDGKRRWWEDCKDRGKPLATHRGLTISWPCDWEWVAAELEAWEARNP